VIDKKAIKHVGDEHVYFTIHEIKVTSSYATAKVSYLQKDEEGYGVSKTLSLSVPGDFQNKMKSLLHSIDGLLRKRFTRYDDVSGKHQWIEELFVNYTRVITLKEEKARRGKRKRKFKVFYKFGQIALMEKIGINLFKSFGLKTPEIILAADQSHVWAKEVTSDSYRMILQSIFETIINQSRGLGRLNPYLMQQYFFSQLQDGLFRQIDVLKSENLTDERRRKLLYTIGRGIWLSFLLGHDDFPPGEEKMAAYLDNVFVIFGLANLSDPIDRQNVIEGIRGTTLVDVLEKIDLVLEGVSENTLFSRSVVRTTDDYYEKLNLSFAPHYSFRLTKAEFKALVRERFKLIQQFLEKYQLVTTATGGDLSWMVERRSEFALGSSI